MNVLFYIFEIVFIWCLDAELNNVEQYYIVFQLYCHAL